MTTQGPDLASFKSWLGLDPADTTDDEVLQMSLDAAIAAQLQVCRLPCDDFGDPYYSADLVEALYIRGLRYSVRRNSPEGIVGVVGAGGEFAGARIAPFDADVLHLEGPFRVTPVA